MKVCEKCEIEIDGKDGDNLCPACDADAGSRAKRNAKARERRAATRDVMASLGMTRVRGALGGTYYE